MNLKPKVIVTLLFLSLVIRVHADEPGQMAPSNDRPAASALPSATAPPDASPFGEAPPGGDSMRVPAGTAAEKAIGERIFLEGIGADGKPIKATRFGGVQVSGASVACMNCHRRSGMGSVEGQDRILPIAGRFLFGTDARAVVNMNSRNLKAFNARHEAYTAESFAAAVREGKSVTGAELGPIMPRFEFSDADVRGLTAYLRDLSKDWSPGVTRSRIRFATVVTPDIPQDRRQAFIDTIKAIVAQRNGNVVGKGQRTMNAAEFMLHTDRAWDLDIWELQGPASTWEKQMDARMKAQPVFALVSGFGDETWEPVRDFCERQKVPCWFPSVEVPPQGADQDFYSVYFSKGVSLEAEVLAKYLKETAPRPKRVVQIHADELAGGTAAEALQTALGSQKPRMLAVDLMVKSGDIQGLKEAMKGVGKNDALVLWLRPADQAALASIKPHGGPVFLSRFLNDSDKPGLPANWLKQTRMVYPYQLPEQRTASLAYFHSWLSMRKLPLVDEAMQSEVFFAMSFLADTLMDVLDNVHREYLIERAESMLSKREGAKSEEEDRDVNFLRLQPGGKIPEANARFAAGQIKRIPRVIPGAKLSETGKRESTTMYPRLTLAVGQRFGSKGAQLVRFSSDPEPKLIKDSDWITP